VILEYPPILSRTRRDNIDRALTRAELRCIKASQGGSQRSIILVADPAVFQGVIDTSKVIVHQISAEARQWMWPADLTRATCDRLMDAVCRYLYDRYHSPFQSYEHFAGEVNGAVTVCRWWVRFLRLLQWLAKQPVPSIGQQLRLLLNETGWTQAQLAKRVGFNRTVVDDHLHDRTAIRPANLQKYEQEFSDALNRRVTIELPAAKNPPPRTTPHKHRTTPR
jgi:hypothetical protein